METQNHSYYDVVVIGGGPAGSTLSTFLVHKGYQVLLIEREKFPRFHIGESLLPSTQLLWEKLGIAERLQHIGQTFKYGGELRFGLDPRKSDYLNSLANFNSSLPDNPLLRPFAYQVERSQFDLCLLNYAREQGVMVFEEAAVKEILEQDDRVIGVRWRTKDGVEYTTKAECVADCSGRQAFMAKNWNFLVSHNKIKTSAVFGQFKHVTREPGIRQGFIHTYFLENAWMWLIPQHSDIMSVGVVSNQSRTDWWSKKSPEEILLTYINRYKFVRDRFEHAEQYSKVRTLTKLPYYSTRSVGNGWILVGDANFFIDPLLSSGVHVAFKSADKAAEAIDKFLKGNRDMTPFKQYEKWSQKYRFDLFKMIGSFYELFKYRFAAETFVRIGASTRETSQFRRNIVSWMGGAFEENSRTMSLTSILMLCLVWIAKSREKFFSIPAWDTYTEYCSEPPLIIPKSIELQKGSKNYHSKPSVAAASQSFQEIQN